jgi:Xaa-Pro aminopeptidase
MPDFLFFGDTERSPAMLPWIGEVRLEDLLLVTEDGCETLTRYPYDFKP